MKVYIVTQSVQYEHTDIDNVFSTFEYAEEYIKTDSNFHLYDKVGHGFWEWKENNYIIVEKEIIR